MRRNLCCTKAAVVSNNLPLRMLVHASAAAVIFFAFQRYALDATLQTCVLWSVAGAIGAAFLVWSQHRRGD